MDKESMKTILNDESTEFNPFFTTRQGKCCPLCWQPCVSILLFALMIIPGIVGSFMVPSPLWIILSALGVVFLILQFYHFTKIEVGYLIVGDKEFVMMKRTKCSMRSQCYLPCVVTTRLSTQMNRSDHHLWVNAQLREASAEQGSRGYLNLIAGVNEWKDISIEIVDNKENAKKWAKIHEGQIIKAINENTNYNPKVMKEDKKRRHWAYL
eukprot:282081_1